LIQSQSIDQIVDRLSNEYPHSHYAFPSIYSIWWKGNSQSLDVAILAKSHGYVAVGFSPNLNPVKPMVGSISVFSRILNDTHLVIEERSLDGKSNTSINLQPPDNIYNLNITKIDGYILSTFSWNISLPNKWCNFTFGDSHTTLIYSIRDKDSALVHHDKRDFVNITFATGQGSSPFYKCKDSCNSAGGTCSDAFTCQCYLGCSDLVNCTHCTVPPT